MAGGPAVNGSQQTTQRKGLGQTNVINTVDATLKVFIYFLVYICSNVNAECQCQLTLRAWNFFTWGKIQVKY